MEKQLYIIEYESAHWCGGISHCVVWATSEDEARDIADPFMDEMMRELFSSSHEDEPELDEDPAHSVNSVELLEGSEYEEYYADEQQRRNFYPSVNLKG